MKSIEKLQEKVIDIFDNLVIAGKPYELYEPIVYTMSLGGKRIRPLLLLQACEMFGGKMKNAVNPAVGIELFHNFTLLHDDIMDKAPLRRGKPTVYKKWDENAAILSGDAMYAMAGQYMIQTRSKAIPYVVQLYNQTAIEVCEGQQYDMNFETRDDVSLSEYIEMIRLKTAVLLGCALKTGAIIAGAKEYECEKIYNVGVNIGLAFQLKDDLLDVYGSLDKFGKVSGGDILEGKKTFLYIKTLELMGAEDAKVFASLYASKKLKGEEKIKKVKGIFDKYKIEYYTKQEMDSYYKTAMQELHKLELPEAKTASFVKYLSALMERDN